MSHASIVFYILSQMHILNYQLHVATVAVATLSLLGFRQLNNESFS